MNKNRLAASILTLALVLATTLISGQAYASKSFDINESTAKAEAPGIVKVWATMLKAKQDAVDGTLAQKFMLARASGGTLQLKKGDGPDEISIPGVKKTVPSPKPPKH